MSQSSDTQPFNSGTFSDVLGVVEEETSQGWARVRMPIQRFHLEDDNTVHGGVIMSLADDAFWSAVAPLLPKGQTAVTSELKVNFLRPARGEQLLAEGRVLYQRGRTIVGEVEIKDTQGNLLAKALGTYMPIEEGSR